MTNNLRTLLIDDHTLFRVGLEGLLASRGIEIVASVGSGHDAQRLVDELNPDIILLDMRMPGINGLEVLTMLREKNESLPIVMLTTSTEENDLLRSLRSGAQGYLLKDMRIMILGIDGYLGWTLALWLGKLGCKISGVDNFSRFTHDT